MQLHVNDADAALRTGEDRRRRSGGLRPGTPSAARAASPSSTSFSRCDRRRSGPEDCGWWFQLTTTYWNAIAISLLRPVSCRIVEPRQVETRGAPRPLRLIAGDVALDFANTVDRPQGQPFDHLARYRDLVGWTSQAGVIGVALAGGLLQTAEQHPQRAGNVTAEAHRLRDSIGDLLAPGTASRDVEEHWLNLRKYVGGAYRAARIAPAASPGDRWQWSDPSDLRTPLYKVAVAAGDLLNSADLYQIKRCANCPWLFVDRSRNHQRRWCDMNDCGRVSKIRLASARRHARQR